ncbi:hypothetical protein PLICRDRAFT_219081 [Plicaturopsis crispa FD-325 SS-3]|nr:hypothetical protein PLICRDRAFT_219081 [Plicaturopsis crispa FD-325 SS-3]
MELPHTAGAQFALHSAILAPLPASATYLPTEILAEIFKCAFFQSRTTPMHYKRFGSYDPSTTQQEREKIYLKGTKWKAVDLASHTVFPYSLSDVCPRWHEILGTVPEYWTRLVINVGSDATPLQYVTSYLKWSRDLGIDVTILRRDGYERSDTILERARVAAVASLLNPHLHRILTLNVEVIDSMALPSLGIDICGTADWMQRMTLSSKIDHGRECRPFVPDDPQSFMAPKLEYLTLDGENFRSMLSSNYPWRKQLPNMLGLTVKNHVSRGGLGKGLSLYDMARQLKDHPRLSYVEINHVSFDPTGPESTVVELSWHSCHLVGISTENLADLFRTVSFGDLESYDISSSVLPPIPDGQRSHYDCFYLTLDDVSGNVETFLRAGDTRELSILNSPSVDDHVIQCIEQECMFPNLQSLTVTDCPGVSAHAIRKLVEARRKASLVAAQEDPGAENMELAVSMIETLGYDGEITREDREWFLRESGVTSFYGTLHE